jgi:RNA binding exosome subunit
VHATEDPDKVKKALTILYPEETYDLPFNEKMLKGHYGNPIIIIRSRIKRKKLIEAFLENLSALLTELDKQNITQGSNSSTEEDSLYLRFDKQSAFKGKLKLSNPDPIHVRIKFRRASDGTKQNIVEISKKLGLML